MRSGVTGSPAWETLDARMRRAGAPPSDLLNKSAAGPRAQSPGPAGPPFHSLPLGPAGLGSSSHTLAGRGPGRAVLLESWSRTHGSQGGAGASPHEGVPPLGGGVAGRPGRGGRLPGQACTKQGWLRSRSDGQLPPGRGSRSSSRRWKARPRPQLRLQLLQPDQDDRPQSTAGTDRWAWFREGLTREEALPREHPDLTRTSLAPTTAILIRAVLAVQLQVAAPLGGQTLPTAAGQLARRAEAPGGRQLWQGGGGHGEGLGAQCPCWSWGRARAQVILAGDKPTPSTPGPA